MTITVRPPNQPRIRFQSGMIGLRPSRSSIATSLQLPGSDWPCRMSLSLGTVRNGTPVLSQMATIRCMPAASSEDGDHQQLGRVTDHGRRIVQGAEDRQALQLGTAQVRRIVQQADRLEIA